MPYNPKSLANLSHRGRRKKFDTALRNIPTDAQAKVYSALYSAMMHDNYNDAKKYLESVNVEGYGFIIQIALKELGGKNGWRALNDIFDRLFGRCATASEIRVKTENENGFKLVFTPYTEEEEETTDK